jgi:hypothetical protein
VQVRRLKLRLSCALVLQLLCSSYAHGYCLVRFSDSTPGVELNSWQTSAGEAVRVAFSNTFDAAKIKAVRAAFEAWAAVECSTLAFEFLDQPEELFDPETTSYAAPFGPLAQIYVFWIDERATPPDLVAGFEGSIAHAFPRHDRNGRLTSASIALNGANPDYPWGVLGEDDPSLFDVQSVMTQLVGEVIGLATSSFTSGTVMITKELIYAGIGPRAPLQDDREGLRYLYWDEQCSDARRPPEPAERLECDVHELDSDAGDGLAVPSARAPSDGADGEAAAHCSSRGQCATGQICNRDGRCVATGDDGASCATAAGAARGPFALLVTVVVALIARRRSGARAHRTQPMVKSPCASMRCVVRPSRSLSTRPPNPVESPRTKGCSGSSTPIMPR